MFRYLVFRGPDGKRIITTCPVGCEEHTINVRHADCQLEDISVDEYLHYQDAMRAGRNKKGDWDAM